MATKILKQTYKILCMATRLRKRDDHRVAIDFKR